MPRTGLAARLARDPHAGALARRARPHEDWLLALPGAQAFASALLGLGRAGARIILPPNLLEGSLEDLLPPGGQVLRELPPGEAPSPGPLADAELVFWTGGSTAAPKAVPRRLQELLTEVDLLESRFGADLPLDTPFLGTVPHGHIYGCLFRVLWPLATGRPFADTPCLEPGDLAAAFQAGPPPVLVASPAHLERLPDLLDLEALPLRPARIFSSGGPLSPEAARRLRTWTPEGVVEVYGSTESGGIASRIQDGSPEGLAWTPFPDLHLAQGPEGALVVEGPRLPGGSLTLGDAVTFLPDGRFLLQGRLDRIVKLSEKRVSLPAVEAALATHPWVQEAALVVLEDPRPQLGAVLVLRPGTPPPAPLALHQTLRAHLASHFEAAALPRRWRVVEALPRSPGGKIPALGLAALFSPHGSP